VLECCDRWRQTHSGYRPGAAEDKREDYRDREDFDFVDRTDSESMDINNVLHELREEREQLLEAILAIERLAAEGKRGRERPPKWLTEQRASPNAPKRRGRPPGKKSASAEKPAG
jgi:hypothetical protein